MATGTVKFFNNDRGYGFIKPDDEGEDLFVHFSELIDNDFLKENDRVEYEIGQGRKGPAAVQVKLQ